MVRPLHPFMGFVNKTIPTAFENSMSYYDTLCVLYNYLHDEILPQINEDVEKIAELTALCNELKDYVDNYFANLDVQEEINNKLDEMAESGELENLIADFIIGGKGQVKYIFPKNTAYTSEFSLITGYNKNILIDCGRSEEYSELTSTLAKYNVEHIDYMEISHFHLDHCGNLIQLYTDGYCDENTVLILPHYTASTWSFDASYAQYSAIMNYLTTNNISYITPYEDYTVSINDNFRFKIYNTNDTYYIDNNINNQYNNASLITLVEHFGQNSLFVGDCYNHALQKIYADGVIPNTIHLYKAGHHGIDRSGISIIDVIRNINILSVVYIVGISDVEKGKCCKGGTGIDFDGQVDSIYITAYNTDNIEFSSFINSMNLVYGFDESGLDNLNYAKETVYVDITNADSFQNGTQNHPFKNLTQAIGYLNRNNGREYTINVASGTYPTLYDNVYARPTLYGCTNTINIVGAGATTILNYGFEIKNCANVNISNLKIVNMLDAKIFSIIASNVNVSGLGIINDSSVGKKYGFEIENNSHVVITDTTIENCNFGVHEYNSEVELSGITFTDIGQQCIYARNGVFKRSDNLTITDASVSYTRYSEAEKPYFEKGLVLWSGTHVYSNGDITTLWARPARFRSIDIEYKIGSGSYTEHFDITSTTTHRIAKTTTSTTKISNDDTVFTTGDSYTVAFSAARHVETLIADGTITLTSDADDISITKIIAH